MIQRTKSEAIFKVLFMVLVGIFVLGTLVSLPLNLSMMEANRENTLPQLFGKQYVAYNESVENGFTQLEVGSVVTFVSPLDQNPVVGDLVVYHTPNGGNELYQLTPGYSMGVIWKINPGTDVGDTYDIVVNETLTDSFETIAASSVIGVGDSVLKGMANPVLFMGSIVGLLVFAVLPLFAALVFLMLWLMVRNRRLEFEEDQRYELQQQHETVMAEEFSSPDLFENSLPVANEPPPRKARRMPIPRKKTVKTAEDTPSAQPIPLAETVPPVRSVNIGAPRNAVAETAPVTEQVAPVQVVQEQVVQEKDPMGQVAQEQELPKKTPPVSETRSSFMDDVIENFTLEHLERELQQVGLDIDVDVEALLAKTNEFAEETTRADEVAASRSLASAPPQELMVENQTDDQVLFLIKEDAIDVNFNQVTSEFVDVQYHADGSGFSITTPKYTADVTVRVSGQK